MPFTHKKLGQLSYLFGKSILMNYRYRIFHTQQLDIKHQIGVKSHHLKFYPISGHVYNLQEAYRELLDFRLVNIQLQNKSSVGC